MHKWLWAKFYDKILRDAERKGLRDWRKALLHNLSGDVLELGCGTGANLEFYPNTLKRLALVEPNIYMRQKLREKIPNHHLNPIEILSDKAEHLALPDNSFDTVVCTLVLCSVENLAQALAEIHRILRPGGQFIFIEHVAADSQLKRYRWQHWLEFIWKRLADGCHLTRCTEAAIVTAGFELLEIKRQSMRGVPPIVRPSIRGIARKI